MKRIVHLLSREWEKAILLAILLVTAGFCVAWLHPSNGTSERSSGDFGRARSSFLAPNALAFMGRGDQVNGQAPLADLFSFSYRDDTKVNKVTPQTGDTEDTEGPGSISGGPEEKTTTETGNGEEVLSLETKPEPKPELRKVRYLGIYTSTTGKKLAAVEIQDPKTGHSQARFWEIGRSANGVQLQAFDGNALRFLAPDGRGGTVSRGATVTIQLQ